MSYRVTYDGTLSVEPPLNPAEIKALNAFGESRRIRTTAGPLDSRDLESTHPDVIDYNEPPEGQPGMWCDVRVSEDGTKLTVDESGEPGDITPWVEYLIDHLLKPDAVFSSVPGEVGQKDLLRQFTFNHVVSGEMKCVGEDGDVWAIRVRDNAVSQVKPSFPEGDE